MAEKDTELSLDIVMQVKTEVTNYLIEQCAESFGVSVERVTNERLRDYCFAGMSRDEFTTVWEMININKNQYHSWFIIINNYVLCYI